MGDGHDPGMACRSLAEHVKFICSCIGVFEQKGAPPDILRRKHVNVCTLMSLINTFKMIDCLHFQKELRSKSNPVLRTFFEPC